MPVKHRPCSQEHPNRSDLLQAGGRKARRFSSGDPGDCGSRRQGGAPPARRRRRWPALRQHPLTATVAVLPAPGGGRRSPRSIASSLRGREPVVTTRATPQPARTYRGLAQVTTPRDGLPARRQSGPRKAALPLARALRALCSPSSQRRAPEPGSVARLDGTPSRRKRRRCQGRVPRRQAADQRHETGVVSRVLHGSRHAQACGTDRNTYQTGFDTSSASEGRGATTARSDLGPEIVRGIRPP